MLAAKVAQASSSRAAKSHNAAERQRIMQRAKEKLNEITQQRFRMEVGLDGFGRRTAR